VDAAHWYPQIQAVDGRLLAVASPVNLPKVVRIDRVVHDGLRYDGTTAGPRD
jgi:hypothetical protein